jgi:hypothetical protein
MSHFQHPGTQDEPAHFAWERHLYAAERIGPWYCSMIETDAAKLGMNHRIISYNDYFL